MTVSDYVFMLVGVFSILVGVAGLKYKASLDRCRVYRDPVINHDQYEAERKMRLERLNAVPMGAFKHQRHTVLAYKARGPR